MNKNRYNPDMEVSQEFFPLADETPGSRVHHNRFARSVNKPVATESTKQKDGSDGEKLS